MGKPTLNEDQFIAELNRRLKAMPWYKWDMAVVAAPPGSAGVTASGYDVVGAVSGGQMAEIEREVLKEFDLVVTKRG